jgi:transaldolase
MSVTDKLKIKVFADGADIKGMKEMYANPLISGFTTNPTLMRRAGVTDYAQFAREVVQAIPDRPISFEVFSDEIAEMERQARLIATWGPNVNVKIPITNTKGESTAPIIERLSADGIVLNITAIMTVDQVHEVAAALHSTSSAIISVFAGRVADTGVDPVPHMIACKKAMAARPHAQLLWASPRELLNIFQADKIGCDIITATNDILVKLKLVGKDLTDYSRETVLMFYNDAAQAGYKI